MLTLQDLRDNPHEFEGKCAKFSIGPDPCQGTSLILYFYIHTLTEERWTGDWVLVDGVSGVYEGNITDGSGWMRWSDIKTLETEVTLLTKDQFDLLVTLANHDLY